MNYRDGRPYRGPKQKEADAWDGYMDWLEKEFPAGSPPPSGSSLSNKGDAEERKKSDTGERTDRDAWEVSAVMEDAGTPPKDVWRARKAAEREAWRARLWLILAPGGVVVLVAWWVFEWIKKALR